MLSQCGISCELCFHIFGKCVTILKCGLLRGGSGCEFLQMPFHKKITCAWFISRETLGKTFIRNF